MVLEDSFILFGTRSIITDDRFRLEIELQSWHLTVLCCIFKLVHPVFVLENS